MEVHSVKNFLLCTAAMLLLMLCVSCGKKQMTAEDLHEKDTDTEQESKTESHSGDAEYETVLSAVRAKWPFYIGLNTEKGLSVLVMENGSGDYLFSVVPNKDDPEEFVAAGFGAGLTLEETKALIRHYDLPDDQVRLHPCVNMISNIIVPVSTMNEQEIKKLFDERYEYDATLPG